MWEQELSSLLEKRYQRTRLANPRYSYRAFARHLKISSGALSDILAGKRKISTKKALEIVRALELEKKEHERLRGLIEKSFNRDRTVLVSGDDFNKFLSHWVYSAVLHFFDQSGVDLSAKAISERLGISIEQVDTVIQHLLKMGLFEIDEKGEIQKKSSHFTTSDNIPSPLIKDAHKQGLKLATEALDKFPVEERDMTSLIFSGNPDKLDQIKKKIREFYESIEMSLSEPPCTQVYRMQVQIFPLCKKEGR